MDQLRRPSTRHRRFVAPILLTILLNLNAGAADEPGPRLELRAGDHLSIIGNTMADRMQHDGWLETELIRRFPEHDLVIRNLGFSADEVNPKLRLRSARFGSPDDWLTRTRADVVFAFFGSNEAYAGRAGLDAFRRDLDDFITHTLAQTYNGKSSPRLVLFSPIAHEDLHDRNLPDGASHNEQLELYTRAMADAARAHKIPFVDLFHPTRALYAKVRRPLTINGIHLTGEGDRRLAEVIAAALFPDAPQPKDDPNAVDRLRRAILDKNFTWFNRYRTVDGYNIYGLRADEKYAEGQTNFVVMQREMEVLDVMTANRDRRVWAAARGGDLEVDDSNTPLFIPTKTNKPGPGPNGTHIFLDGEAAIEKMTVARGMKVNLFASEAEFPALAKPVQMAFDPKGRLWCASWPSYPHWKPKEPLNDKLLIFEDTNGDGKADTVKVFADKLHCPTGFEFYNGGVLIAQAPDLLFLKDTDGDDRADVRIRVLSGLDSADTHHTANSFQLDPGGALYFQEGVFHHTQVETPWGPPVRNINAGVYRYEPRTQKFEVYVPYGFANPHGHVFDRWGQDIVVDGTGANPYHGTVVSGHLDFPEKHPRAPQVYQQRTRPCPGVEILSSRHFPEANQGNFLVANVIGFQGILQYKIQDQGSSLHGVEVEPLVSSTDPNFRPSDIKVGPDGAIYFLDWQNPIIGHLQHHIRDPNRDRTHGRIYRISAVDRPLLKPVAIAGEPIAHLLDLLKEPEDRVRYRVRIELGGRPTDDVIAAVKTWVAGLDTKDPEHEHHLLEALWVHQAHNVVATDLLKRLLQSPDFRARAAAVRVLCAWRDRVPDALSLLKTLAADPYPRVRLEAVRAASFFTAPEAIEVPLISADHPTDEYLDYTRGETMRALEPYWRKAFAEGRDIPLTSEAGARFFLGRLKTDDLLKMKRTRAVDLELLFRKGIRDESRREALRDLAQLEGKGELRVLLEAIRRQDRLKDDQDESVVFDLVRLLTDRGSKELADLRPELEALATGAQQPVTRQLGFVALIAADGDVERAWMLGTRSIRALRDLVNAMPLVRDPGLRARLYPRVEPLLDGLPRSLAGSDRDAKGTVGRYVRIELPGRARTLTLAEVEVFSDGRNVARTGTARQSSTAHGGIAQRALDGNTSPRFGDGGQTHTAENTRNPWWEVDLGAEVPIDSVVIYNRDDGQGRRLNGFSLVILDAQRSELDRKGRIPAPSPRTAIPLGGGGSEGTIRRAAMNALTSVRGQETQTFKALARFVREGTDRHAAIRALLRIPTAYWPAEEAQSLLDRLIADLKTLPTRERTSPAALDAIQLGDALASLLPRDQALAARKQLGELGVRIIRVGTVTDQMRFDVDRIAVRAGRPVEIVFENTDLMPHNFVVTRPGALEAVGLLAESTATQPGALERNYVPPSPQVLLASRLLPPRDVQKLTFTAPTEPGVYPYVCTYPGHWRRMYGSMYVVADLDEYLADPEGYLAKHPLRIADELLKSNRPRKEWTFDDLASGLEELNHDRSFADGRQMFEVANCVACHRLDGTGTEVGPDLAKLDPKKTPADLLRSILDPSAQVEEKYRTHVFATESGRVVTGLVLEETPETVKVAENPLAKAPPVVLKKGEIVERSTTPTSIMPKGLLDKLSREEILDLLAFVVARGDRQNPLYQNGHNHSH